MCRTQCGSAGFVKRYNLHEQEGVSDDDVVCVAVDGKCQQKRMLLRRVSRRCHHALFPPRGVPIQRQNAL
eukprot:scaffold2167_cov363-Pavlova_lutheri.AAC.12